MAQSATPNTETQTQTCVAYVEEADAHSLSKKKRGQGRVFVEDMRPPITWGHASSSFQTLALLEYVSPQPMPSHDVPVHVQLYHRQRLMLSEQL